jgi:murein DD-endopeptidase MepM/ murein hydrolase activator NlpD
MKIVLILLFIILNFSLGCGDGVPEISHSGICDGYADWSTSAYKLPWPVGVTHEVSQGNCGAASHVGSQRYAYDFDMDIGSAIVASRAGVVLEMEEQYADGGGCSELNYISIRHSDGTIAKYLHLTQNGVLVNVGNSVNQGDSIALSGNSGCSSGPHLHFVVFTSDEKDSVPVTFSNTSINTRGLRAGKSYTAQ